MTIPCWIDKNKDYERGYGDNMPEKKSFHELTWYDILFELGLYQKVALDLLTTEESIQPNDISIQEHESNNTCSTQKKISIKKSSDFIHLTKLLCSQSNLYWYCPACEEKNSFIFHTPYSNNPYHEIHKNVGDYLIENQLVENGDFEIHRKNSKIELNKQVSKFFEKNNENFFDVIITCTHNSNHQYIFNFLLKTEKKGDEIKIYFIKVGQYPSLADYQAVKKTKYQPFLNSLGFASEYTRALGLYAAGVGIGSFVYLRRILESLVYQAFKKANKDSSISESEYNEIEYETDGITKRRNRKFDEKITLLKDYLPAMLVKHSYIYGIISKGIHELSELECQEIFPSIQKGIELILEQLYEENERIKLEKEAEIELNKISTKIKSRDQNS